jgi:hypothetical protein
MIVWLASYPRSGNTLLRTILKHCLNLYSYQDEPVYQENPLRDNSELVGHIEQKEPWAVFYEKACQSASTFLIKTHHFPRDEHPFIYLVRDGRSAIQSYRKFHRDYNKLDKPLIKLILGDDSYGDWETHYHQWNARPVKKMVLRFEEIVNISIPLLKKLAEFIGFAGDIKPWVNPLEDLREIESDFFNQGNSSFLPGAEWTDTVDYFFNIVYQEHMEKLGYHTSLFRGLPRGATDKDLIKELIALARELLHEKRALTQVCDERDQVIRSLHGICEERLELIDRLHRVINTG